MMKPGMSRRAHGDGQPSPVATRNATREEVLEHEDADGQATGQGSRLTGSFERLDGEDGRCERQGEAHHGCGPQIEIRGEGKAEGTGSEEHRTVDDRGAHAER